VTIRNLGFFFHPTSLAIIGATERRGAVGSVLTQNVLRAGFAGPIYPVNPKRSHVHGLKAYARIDRLPGKADLAVVATPPATVPGVIAGLGAAGTRAAVVLTAGFGEGGSAEGARLRQGMLDAARPHLLRIIGPNCLGIMMPQVKLDASFAGTPALSGRIAFLTQSGAVATAVVDWATSRGIGFSQIVTLGDMTDVDIGDCLDYLAREASAQAILLYVESITNARKFMSAARSAARVKPVIIVKAGRFEEGARAAHSHTGALAGSDKVYQSAFRRAGLLRVLSLEELFEAVATLSKIGPFRGERLGIVTNGGGAGVLATDMLIGEGGKLAELSSATLAALDARLPRTWSHGNPVDIIGDAGPERYGAAIEAVLADANVDAALVLNCPTAVTSSTDVALGIASARRPQGKPLLSVWLGGNAVEAGRRALENRGIPGHSTPESGVRAFMHLVGYARAQEELAATPPSIPAEVKCDAVAARRVIEAALTSGRDWLDALECKSVLAAYGIPVARAVFAATPVEAQRAADEIGGAVALKIQSPDIIHKSDVGGVVLGLAGKGAVEAEAKAMLARVGKAMPAARGLCFVVEEMIVRPGASELIVGMNEDAGFGPVLMFGEGGVGVEVIDDTTIELPPLDLRFARAMLERTRIFRRLQGYRDRKAADLDAIALTLLKVSQLVVDFAEVAEIDVNPLLADSAGVVAVDARIRIVRAEGHPHRRLAIKPYPAELETTVTSANGRTFHVRPIRAEDEPRLIEGFGRLSSEEVRLRFHAPVKTLDHVVASRFSQINYDREMALILTDPGPPGTTPIYAVARLAADPDNETAEYAIVVGGEFAGQGLGRALLELLIDHARDRGLKRLVGPVLRENARMLNLCRDLGFTIGAGTATDATVMTSLEVGAADWSPD
jgi:acetyltransferase